MRKNRVGALGRGLGLLPSDGSAAQPDRTLQRLRPHHSHHVTHKQRVDGMGHLLRRARLTRVVALGALIAALTTAASAGAIAYGVVASGGGSGAAIATASPSAVAAQFVTDLAVLSQRQLVAVGSSSFLVSSDGGTTWQTSAPRVGGIGGGFVLDRVRWWAASASTGSGRVTVARTSDAGRNWTRTTLPATYPDGYGAAYFSFED